MSSPLLGCRIAAICITDRRVKGDIGQWMHSTISHRAKPAPPDQLFSFFRTAVFGPEEFLGTPGLNQVQTVIRLRVEIQGVVRLAFLHFEWEGHRLHPDLQPSVWI